MKENRAVRNWIVAGMLVTPLLVVGAAAWIRYDKIPELESKDYGQYALIHRPEKGCPSGWSELKGVFHERDGRKEDGCGNPAYEKRVDDHTIRFSMDMLKGGESCCHGPGEPVVVKEQK